MSIVNHLEIIKTNRLRLSPLIAQHAKAMFPILSDKGLYKFTGEEPPFSEIDLQEKYRKLESRKSPNGTERWLNWLVSLVQNDVPIGYVQTTISQSGADIAWVIGSQWQGNGYASEAAIALVEWLQIIDTKVIRALINPNHLASQRVASNAGLGNTESVEDGEEIWTFQVPREC